MGLLCTGEVRGRLEGYRLVTVHCYLMAHPCKTKQTLLRTTKIRALQGRLWSAVTLLKAGACPMRRQRVKQHQLVKGAKDGWIYQGSDQGRVGNLDPSLAFEWALANIWKSTNIYVLPGTYPQGQDDAEPSPATSSMFTLLCWPSHKELRWLHKYPDRAERSRAAAGMSSACADASSSREQTGERRAAGMRRAC